MSRAPARVTPDMVWQPTPKQLARIHAIPSADDHLFLDETLWRRWGCGGDFDGDKPRWRIYFLQAENSRLIRIGVAQNLALRVENHRSSSPEALALLGTMPGGVPLEREIHEAFADLLHHGSWYRVHPLLIETIQRIKVL